MSTAHSSDLIGQRSQRIEKIDKLLKLGFNPFPSTASRTNCNVDLIERFDELDGSNVTLVGRLLTWRNHGEITFSDLQDDSGKIQLYIRLSELQPTDISSGNLGEENLSLLDIGDHIEVSGHVTKTKTGQESLLVHTIKLLSKSIRPLPNKWTGIVDKEARFRRRYLDMTMNPLVRERFKRRTLFWNSIREFLNNNGFYEINTPVLEHTTGGADAKPFITHYDALGEDFYLRISHELPLKRLLGAGYEKVYDIGARFRNEGFSDEHLPEHIAMEWYWAYADWRDGMKLTEDMFKFALEMTFGTLKFNVRGFEVDLNVKWEEIDYADIIQKHFDVDIFDDTLERLSEVLTANSSYKTDDLVLNRSRLVDGLWKLIRKDLAGPVFLTGVPKFLSPLAKSNKEDPRKTDRFHLIIAGSEMANAFSELNDPLDQMDRFMQQQKLREGGDDEAHMLDIDFVEMLEYGMPPAVGFGLSERLFWIFEGVSAREGVPFPPLRRGFENVTKEIYKDQIDLDAVEKSFKESSRTTHVTPQASQNDMKMAIILDKDLDGWRLTNTIAHIAGKLGNNAGSSFTGRTSFTVGEVSIPSNSQYPIVTLGAKQAQLHTLLGTLGALEVEYMVYIDEMIDNLTDDDVQGALDGCNIDDLHIVGIGVYGEKELVQKISKKFSLWG